MSKNHFLKNFTQLVTNKITNGTSSYFFTSTIRYGFQEITRGN